MSNLDPNSSLIFSLIFNLFYQHRGKGVLIISYETQRRYSKMFEPAKINPTRSCDLLICDEVGKQEIVVVTLFYF